MKKRADGRYQKAITIDGKKQFFYGKTQAEVNKKMLAYEKKKEQGRTFEEVAEEWYDKHSITLSPTTIPGYRITSYNVCYTKLLRIGIIPCELFCHRNSK